jgi:hypothetical protein
MPADIEEIFEELGLSLYPKNEQDLVTGCTCPDTANPCKHLAAVYLLLGEEFDRDPFLLFTMRGMRRDKLLAIIEKNLPQALDAEANRDEEDAAPAEEPKQALQLESGHLLEGRGADAGGCNGGRGASWRFRRRCRGGWGRFLSGRGRRRCLMPWSPVYKRASQHAVLFLLGEPLPGAAAANGSGSQGGSNS